MVNKTEHSSEALLGQYLLRVFYFYNVEIQACHTQSFLLEVKISRPQMSQASNDIQLSWSPFMAPTLGRAENIVSEV